MKDKVIEKRMRIPALILMILGVMAFSGCKGRTMENMEPTGDTVEVTVDYPDAVLEHPDSAGQALDSLF